jgi:hypothetical protein
VIYRAVVNVEFRKSPNCGPKEGRNRITLECGHKLRPRKSSVKVPARARCLACERGTRIWS